MNKLTGGPLITSKINTVMIVNRLNLCLATRNLQTPTENYI